MPALNIKNVQRKEYNGSKYITCETVIEGESVQASIWEKDKEGKDFPNFNQIADGVIEGNPWKSPKNGKWTIYAPKPKQGFGGGMGKQLMAEKAKTIEHAQERKEKAIASSQERNEVMYAKQSAALLIAHHPAYNELTDANLLYTFQNLTRAILSFDPNTSLTALQADDITVARETKRAEQFENEINPDDVPF